MCYSKEVSLLSGSIIAVGSSFAYWKYIFHRARNKVKKELVPAFLAIIIGISFIGVHQFFEFFAILNADQIIYKTGLVFSISAMYFWLRSLEHLTRTKLGSGVALIIIAVIAVYMFGRDMAFENVRFWVRGFSHIVWVYAWLALFIYWNVAIVYLYRVMVSRINRKLLFWYAIAVADLTFVLSFIYVYGAVLVQRSDALGSLFGGYGGLAGMYRGLSVVQDLPSIWCVFASIQVITILIFFHYANRSYDVKSSLRVREVSRLAKAKLVMWSAVIWLLFYFEVPYLSGVALKMIFT